MIQTLAYCTPILLAFACMVTYNYIMDLRRALASEKTKAETFGRLYEATANDLRVSQGKPPYTEFFYEQNRPKDQQEPAGEKFNPGGIGPAIGTTMVNDREAILRQQETATEQPQYGRRPSEDAISNAAKRAAAESNGN